MRDFILSRFIDRMERTLGVELDYLREVARSAPGALVPIGLMMPSGAYGETVSSDVLHLVRIGATLAQECGECLEIAVNLARADGLDAELIRAALSGPERGLSELQAAGLEFGAAVGAGVDPVEDRALIREYFGDRGVIEASLAAASSLVFPGIKRGMGFARACDIDALGLSPKRAVGVA